MKRLLGLFFYCFVLSSFAWAGIYISEPQGSEIIVFDRVIQLKGMGRDLSLLKVNGQPIGFNSDGEFSCGLVLNLGKNFVEIRALNRNNEHFVTSLKILRLAQFPDMDTLYEGEQHWARKPIIYLSTLGFIEGYPDGNFYPSNPITRGELATWLARMKKLPIRSLADDVFYDVPKEHWRGPYIRAVSADGLMPGYDKTNFGVDDPIERRQAVKIALLVEDLGLAERIKPLFVDVFDEEQDAASINTAGQQGLIKGVQKDAPVFEPNRPLTRAEAAMLISRFNLSINSVKTLFDFTLGYGEEQSCRLNIKPQFISFTVTPDTIKKGEAATINIAAEIAPRQGFYPIAKTLVDLSEIGGPTEAELYDDGTNGDKVKRDNIYSLAVSLSPGTDGANNLTVTAYDELGWEGKRSASLFISR